MLARRIETIEDVNGIYTGIKSGITGGSFTEKELMEVIGIIIDKNTTFWIFEDNSKVIGFGSIKDRSEVAKVFIVEEFRGQGYGKRISLWLKKRVLSDGLVPISWVKNTNKWKDSQKEMGMIKLERESWGEVSKYMLMDFEKYVEAIKKYKIGEIEIKKPRIKIEDMPTFARLRERMNIMGSE